MTKKKAETKWRCEHDKACDDVYEGAARGWCRCPEPHYGLPPERQGCYFLAYLEGNEDQEILCKYVTLQYSEYWDSWMMGTEPITNAFLRKYLKAWAMINQNATIA